MHERRLSVESNQAGGSATSSRVPAPTEKEQAELTAVDKIDVGWGSESALLERTVRTSSAVPISQKDARDKDAREKDKDAREPTAPLPTRSAIGTKAVPPRPANFPSAPKNPPVVRATPERLTPLVPEPTTEFHGFQSEPPGGSTRAYDRSELERLLKASDNGPPGLSAAANSAEALADTAIMEGGSTQTLPPAPPAALLQTPPQSNQGASPEADEPTTAYIRPSVNGLLETTLSLGERQHWGTPGSEPEVRSGSSTTVGFAGADVRFRPLAGIGADAAEVTGPAIARRSLLPLQAHQSRWTRLIWGFAALLCCLAAIAVWTQSARRSPESASLRGSWDRLTASKQPRAASEATRLIQLEVSVDPPQAKLYLDKREASNPLKISYPADGEMHEFSATAPGFQSRSYRIKFDRDVSVFFGLMPTVTPQPEAVPSVR